VTTPRRGGARPLTGGWVSRRIDLPPGQTDTINQLKDTLTISAWTADAITAKLARDTGWEDPDAASRPARYRTHQAPTGRGSRGGRQQPGSEVSVSVSTLVLEEIRKIGSFPEFARQAIDEKIQQTLSGKETRR
jgi:hypothetical protein